MAQTRMGVATVDGWKIIAIVESHYEAYKDGESVRLDSDTLRGMLELIDIREGHHETAGE